MASDIKQESVNTFLQYIYEGYMMLTEENCRDIEKMAKLLQVDTVVKCCVDFYKCLTTKTGVHHGGTNFNFKQNSDIEHVKSGNIHKTVLEYAKKRGGENESVESSDYVSGSKRQRISQNVQGSRNQNFMQDGSGYKQECLEVVHNDPAERDKDGWPVATALPRIPRSQSISVASKQSKESSIQVIDIPDDEDDDVVTENASLFQGMVSTLRHLPQRQTTRTDQHSRGRESMSQPTKSSEKSDSMAISHEYSSSSETNIAPGSSFHSSPSKISQPNIPHSGISDLERVLPDNISDSRTATSGSFHSTPTTQHVPLSSSSNLEMMLSENIQTTQAAGDSNFTNIKSSTPVRQQISSSEIRTPTVSNSANAPFAAGSESQARDIALPRLTQMVNFPDKYSYTQPEIRRSEEPSTSLGNQDKMDQRQNKQKIEHEEDVGKLLSGEEASSLQ